MEYGICLLTVIPVRKSPSEKAEMVTQLLFGECFSVEETKDSWLKIICSYDNYEGWIDKKCVKEVAKQTFKQLNNHTSQTVTSSITKIIREDKTEMFILPGSTLHFFNNDNYSLTIENENFFFEKESVEKIKKTTQNTILETGLQFINAPYIWGGRSLFGIDCSGFVQVVFKINKIKLPRDAFQQKEMGLLVKQINDIKQADIAFFQDETGKIIHVGIALERNKIIHASGLVRIDKLDSTGIFNEEINQYTHRLNCIKRIL